MGALRTRLRVIATSPLEPLIRDCIARPQERFMCDLNQNIEFCQPAFEGYSSMAHIQNTSSHDKFKLDEVPRGAVPGICSTRAPLCTALHA